MVRVAVCDDEITVLRQMEFVIQTTFDENEFDCELFCFQSGEELLEAYKKQPFDILFLDIRMPGQSGFDVAKEVRRISYKTLLLFVTSQDELVYDSFHYHPFYFLRKGTESDFEASLRDTVQKIALFIKCNEMMKLSLNSGEFRSVLVQDIVYLKSNRNFVDYHFASGEYIPVREQINIAEEKLIPYSFIRIHKQYIVNMQHINRISVSRYPEIQLSNGLHLPIGRKYKDAVSKKYTEYTRVLL